MGKLGHGEVLMVASESLVNVQRVCVWNRAKSTESKTWKHASCSYASAVTVKECVELRSIER